MIEVMGNTIRIPQGDTGATRFVSEGNRVDDKERALFTVAQNDTIVLRKNLAPDEDGSFPLFFTHEETAKLRPATYGWSLRLVGDGAFDANGRIVSAKSCHTPVMSGKFIVLPVEGGAR